MHPFKKMIYMLKRNSIPDVPVEPPTSYSWFFSSPGRTSSSLACAQTEFPLVWYSAVSVLDIGVQLYTGPSLSTVVGSGDLWYQDGIDGISYRIDNLGQIAEATTCVI